MPQPGDELTLFRVLYEPRLLANWKRGFHTSFHPMPHAGWKDDLFTKFGEDWASYPRAFDKGEYTPTAVRQWITLMKKYGSVEAASSTAEWPKWWPQAGVHAFVTEQAALDWLGNQGAAELAPDLDPDEWPYMVQFRGRVISPVFESDGVQAVVLRTEVGPETISEFRKRHSPGPPPVAAEETSAG